MTGHAVVFDIGRVLCFPPVVSAEDRWEKDNLEALRRDPDQWASITKDFAVLHREASLGSISEDELKIRAQAILGISDIAATSYMNAVWADTVGVLNTELMAYVRNLRTRCSTGILSNSFVGSSERREQAHHFCLYGDEVIYSDNVGLLKPDPRIYLLMCERLRVDPADVFFVDDLQKNVDAARAVGMAGVRYHSNETVITSIETWLGERGR